MRASPSPPAPEAGAGDEAEPSEGSAPGPAGQLALDEEPGGGRPGGERPVLTLAEPRSGPTPKRRSSNATSVSVTDPEAKLRGKPGQRPHLVYRGQVAVDRKQRVIVACRGEQADGFEGDAVEPLLGSRPLRLSRAGLDRRRLGLRGRARLAGGRAAPDHRLHPAAADDAAESRRGADHGGAAPGAGRAGALQEPGRDRGAPAADGRRRGRDRRAEEPRHRRRAQRRGTPHFHVQLLLNCTAVNCKRLADHAQQAQTGVAAAPQTRRPPPSAAAAQPSDSRRRSQPLARRTPRRRPLRLGLHDLAQLSPRLLRPSWTGP